VCSWWCRLEISPIKALKWVFVLSFVSRLYYKIEGYVSIYS